MPRLELRHRFYEINTGSGFQPASPSAMLCALLAIACQCNADGFLAVMRSLKDGTVLVFPRPEAWRGPTALTWSLRYVRPITPEEN